MARRGLKIRTWDDVIDHLMDIIVFLVALSLVLLPLSENGSQPGITVSLGNLLRSY